MNQMATNLTDLLQQSHPTSVEKSPFDNQLPFTNSPGWQSFFQAFSKMGIDEIRSRQKDINRLLKENGVTYNIYNDPSGENRLWSLDLIPFLIEKKEWDYTEKGLVQRAELLNLVLEDFYGDRKLVKDGILPMELVYHHKGFLRQCDKMPKRPGKHSLLMYSANIARSGDGRVWIISDRTQAPSGSGYALENRTAFARVIPELFHGLKVRHLSPYFDALTTALQTLSPRSQSNPRVVILTPGPGNETYFEHSYLATYLGFALVQGNDLMVSDNFVWLKTLGGLEKVDVILRRVDDVYCDPLEFRQDSLLGIPGLMQAIRSGNVAIANPLGSGVIENPGLMPFLNNVCQYFMGQDLLIPNIASWWCGQPRELKYVLDNLDTLVIKPIHRDAIGSSAINGPSLSKQKLEELRHAILKTPYLYVGQEKINFSSTPALINGKMESRNALFRTFLVSNGGSYVAMKGGLTRTASDNNDFLISNQLGGMSKDTWVLSPEPEPLHISRRQLAGEASQANSGVLPSHTAENLFWVGRYVERFLGNARFIRTVIQFVAEGNRLVSEDDVVTEQKLLQALTQYSFTYPGFLSEKPELKFADPWPELRDVMMNPEKNGSLCYNFNLFSRAVYAVRDPWSIDTWRVLRNMEEEWSVANNGEKSHIKMLSVLDNVITSTVAFIGLNRESISREQGWIMLDLGRKIEQCLLLISMLRATLVHKLSDQVEYNLQEAVLKSHESLVNYRYKYRAHLKLSLVLDLLLFDTTNPRSLIFQMERLKAYCDVLPKAGSSKRLVGYERLIFEAYTFLRLSDRDRLSKPEISSGQYKTLDKFLAKLYGILSNVPVAISKTYFKHAQVQKQLFISESI